MKKKLQNFTIVIPTRNKSKKLLNTLKYLTNINYPSHKFEIIVVDNSSGDIKLQNAIFLHKKRNNNAKIRYIAEPSLGPSFARNKGIENAKYQHIICIDDDVMVDKNLLRDYSHNLDKYPDTALMAGRIVAVSKHKNLLREWMRTLGSENSWVFSNTVRNEKKLTVLKFPDDLISANLLVNKKFFKKKVFNERFGRIYGKSLIFSEDLYLTMKALSEGKKVIYDPSMVSSHYISKQKMKLWYVINRFFRSGIEHKLLDTEFEVRNLRFYKWDSKRFINYLMIFVKKANKRNLLNLIREVLYLIGYNWPIRWL